MSWNGYADCPICGMNADFNYSGYYYMHCPVCGCTRGLSHYGADCNIEDPFVDLDGRIRSHYGGEGLLFGKKQDCVLSVAKSDKIYDFFDSKQFDGYTLVYDTAYKDDILYVKCRDGFDKDFCDIVHADFYKDDNDVLWLVSRNYCYSNEDFSESEGMSVDEIEYINTDIKPIYRYRSESRGTDISFDDYVKEVMSCPEPWLKQLVVNEMEKFLKGWEYKKMSTPKCDQSEMEKIQNIISKCKTVEDRFKSGIFSKVKVVIGDFYYK